MNEWAATDSVEPFMCNHCNGNSLCSVEQSFHCRVCGAWDGDNHKSGPFDVESMWRKAGNRVQWRAPR